MNKMHDIRTQSTLNILVIGTLYYLIQQIYNMTETIQSGILNEFKPYISMNDEVDMCRNSIAEIIMFNVDKYTKSIDKILRNNMICLPWGSMTDIYDESAYAVIVVESITKQIRSLESVLKVPHQRYFLDEFIVKLAITLKSGIYMCKEFNDIGAKQLLLDIQFIKDKLSYTITPNSSKILLKHQMESIELLIKVIMTNFTLENSTKLIDIYYSYIADRSVKDFVAILKLKMIPKRYHPFLINEFTSRLPDSERCEEVSSSSTTFVDNIFSIFE